MKAHATLVLVWIITGLGAVVGSILGGAGGETTLYIGACVGGALATILAVWLCTRLGWLAHAERHGATIGALLGFAIAAPIAVMNLDTPVTPIVACALAGVGALLGAGRARRVT